jgi:membrane protein DedA with SNARE-associated domain
MGVSNETGNDINTGTGRGKFVSWLKKSLIPLAGLAGAIAIFVTVGWVYLRYPDFFKGLEAYGYLGVFVISLILNATVIIPVSAMAVVSSLGGALPLPFVVGVVGAIGAAIGEITGYVAGRAGRDLLAKNRIYVRVEGWVHRWGMLAVFILSIFPFLFDIVGIIAGATRMPVWKFLIGCWLGRTILYVAVAYLGYFGFDLITKWFN